jgi:signal transduction histidine kinase
VENAFKFQHQFINHLSHELKTPLAVMMTNAEVALKEDTKDNYRKCLQFQTSALVEVANIIDTMLDVTKNENQFSTEFSEQIRIDELLFECLEEMSLLHNEASFNFEIDPSIEKSEKLTVTGNSRMLRIAFLNLLKNAINYAGNQYATIEIQSRQHIQVNFINDGPTLADEEKKYLFKYLFRGSNSHNTKGFGLGLMLIHRIFTLHQAHIDYSITADGKNCFSVQLNPIGY